MDPLAAGVMSDDREGPWLDPDVTWGGPDIFPVQAAYRAFVEARHTGHDDGGHHEPDRAPGRSPEPGPHSDDSWYENDGVPGSRAWREREFGKLGIEISHRSL